LQTDTRVRRPTACLLRERLLFLLGERRPEHSQGILELAVAVLKDGGERAEDDETVGRRRGGETRRHSPPQGTMIPAHGVGQQVGQDEPAVSVTKRDTSARSAMRRVKAREVQTPTQCPAVAARAGRRGSRAAGARRRATAHCRPRPGPAVRSHKTDSVAGGTETPASHRAYRAGNSRRTCGAAKRDGAGSASGTPASIRRAHAPAGRHGSARSDTRGRCRRGWSGP
jgi:hypothetical protein